MIYGTYRCDTHTCVHICDTHTRVHTGVGNELRATEGTRCSSERCHSQQGGALQGAFFLYISFICLFFFCSSERWHFQQGGALQGAFIYVYIFFC